MTKAPKDAVDRNLLSIGELARRSGVATATVRSWETRHGFPHPVRLVGGHRRYREQDVVLVAEVHRLRQAGLTVSAAVAAATTETSVVAPGGSFFAGLRAGHSGLRSQTLTKNVLLAMTTAMEDEYCARAVRPVLYGAFQRVDIYRRSQRRWQEFARTAATATVFADFDRVRAPSGRPTEVPIAANSPLRREWAMVCDAPGYSACVLGWELPSQTTLPDRDRRFETIWSLDPLTVRDAARIGASLAATALPDHTFNPPENPPPASADLDQATALFARILAYTQRATTRRPTAS